MMSCSSSSNLLNAQVIRAKIQHINFMMYHNLSRLMVEHLSPLNAKMFPNSKITESFKCSQTKYTYILNGAMKPTLKFSLVEYMMEGRFSLVNDGTNDTAIKQMNALSALIFDVNNSKCVACNSMVCLQLLENTAQKQAFYLML